ncbi:MAG TPA: DUF4350 domain-containing protein [Burkholderiaceae bacterium]|nr:DUF4350 domain-containing protein [Burkholderiaceae bacterium]
MTLTRQHGVTALVAAVLVAGAVWFARHTEWVDEEVRDPPSAELRSDPNLRLKRVLARAGAEIATPDNLERLPPRGATLVLSSWNWDLFPERSAALRRWVEAGGDLVVPNFGFRRDGLAWVPVKWRPMRRPAGVAPAASAAHETDEDDDQDDDDTPRRAPPAAKFDPSTRLRPTPCRGVNEPAGVTPAFGLPRAYATCLWLEQTLHTAAPLLWALDGPNGHVVVRVPVGRGSVTLSSAPLPWDNETVLERDNALIAVAATRAQPGRAIWLVTDEVREPLLAFLWSHGAPAILLGAAALAFALWRGALRFGPRIAAAPLARRSMAEQIRGTAAFIARRGSPALHAAELRALNDAATPRIRGFAAMVLGQRAQAIADRTGLDAHALAHALNPALHATPTRHPAAALALLETARRRLVNRPQAPDASH